MNDDKTQISNQQSNDSTQVSDASEVIDTTEVVSTEKDNTLAHTGQQDGASEGGITQLQPGYSLKDRFELGEKLGEGGMGAVFRATDLRRVETGNSDPTVAIKVITGDFARDSRAFVALQRETDKSQTLAHPNIITVYDFDRDGSIFFMTMESLSGNTLDGYIGNHPDKAAWATTVGYIQDLASAIGYAHKKGIVHSDLKPANIFITADNVLKVLDFGIARAYSAIEGEKTAADPDEISGLTPSYASYEMFERQPPHPADDVYALGLIAYEMLTGQHPFDRKSAPRAQSQGMKPQRIKGLPGYQWKAIARALEFRREDRWQNAEEFRKQFSGSGRRVKQLASALAVVIIAFGAYLVLFQPEAGPDIPFDELPAETQEAVIENLNEGKQALGFGDINGALFYLDKAYALHPRNPDVVQAIDALIAELLVIMENSPVGEQRQQVSELLKYPSLSQNRALQNKQKSLN
ncbi:serine/threonine protein kinase [Litorivivens sp.]|uniref:serine/threonine protein kinase n=1 Tax=Litorivivens sp. TaxID=2020868 RepID=UPI0035690979